MKWISATELPLKEKALPDVVLTQMKGGQVFAYDTKHNLAGLKEILKHNPDIKCMCINKKDEPETPSTDNGWIEKKPEFKENCLLVTAIYLNKPHNYWDYQMHEIKKTDGLNDKDEPAWYWGIYEVDGEEWGDIADFEADLYKVIALLPPR